VIAYYESRKTVVFLSDGGGGDIRSDNYDAVELMTTLASVALTSSLACDVDEQNGIIQSIFVH
jgi:hypothetical protein